MSSSAATTERGHPPDVVLSYCAAQVRTHDPERYLATLFAPPQVREALFALYAFDHEIAKVRHVVSEPMAGMVRWQWWREALDGIITGSPPAHPVAQALTAVFRQGTALPHGRLEAAIDAQEAALSGELPDDLVALERHLEATSGGITLVAVGLLSSLDQATHDAAMHLGLALGIVGLLRNLGHDLEADRLLVPREILSRHGLEPWQLTPGSDRLRPVIADLAARASEHLRAARRDRRAIASAALPALLPAPLLDASLRRLRRADHAPAALERRAPGALAPIALAWRHTLGVF